jgi:hypothetical protein
LFEWSRFSPQRDDGVTGEEFYGIMSKALTIQDISISDLLTPYIGKRSYPYIIPGDSDQRGPLATALKIPNFPTQGVIIKKPKDSWSETLQEFCFLVMNEHVQFVDENKLGKLLEESY